MFYSPLEQFERILIGILTNSTSIMLLVSLVMLRVFKILVLDGNGFRVPNRYQIILEGLQSIVCSIIIQTIGVLGQSIYPLIFTLLLYVLSLNLIGLIPYSFTVTAHLVITLTLARCVWFGKRLIGIRLHGIKLMGRFRPIGTPLNRIWLRVPLELLGFVITAVSLSVRLFANIMAGHILLKVIAGFSWGILLSGLNGYIMHIVPRSTLCLLVLLETGVAFIQAYVFTLLVCIYVTDMRLGGH